MASILPSSTNHSYQAVLVIIIIIFSAAVAARKPIHGFNFGEEKQTHLHFYYHDTLSGPKPTAVRVAEAPTTDATSAQFGRVVIFDDPLTEGPNLTSKLLGRAQGLYAFATQAEVGLLLTTNLAFVEGKYNGSTLAILGRDVVLDKVREMPVVGGSGYFRLARGYALAKTYVFNVTSMDAIVEYDVYVIHH